MARRKHDLPQYVERVPSRHGGFNLYFRRGHGARVMLPKDHKSDDFKLAYANALAGHIVEKVSRPVHGDRTIGAAVVDYYSSDDFRNLRPNSKKGYRARMEAIRLSDGHRSLSGMTPERIEKFILRPFDDRPGAKGDTLKKLRILIRHARKMKWLDHDPTEGLKRPKGKEIRAWEEHEIERFERRWPVGTKQRLAFALMLFTGQRRSDVHRMTWADIDDGRIRVVQQKTGKKLRIRLHADLESILAAAPRDHMTIINTAYGKPFTVDGFSDFMRDAITEAGLPMDAQPHGLRKAAGRRLAEAGATAHQIMAVLGHSTLSEAERYTRAADQQQMADDAILKVEGQKRNKGSQTNVVRFGNEPKKVNKRK